MTNKEKANFRKYFNKYKDEFTDDEIVGGYIFGWKPEKGQGAGDAYGQSEMEDDEETMRYIDTLDNLARELRGGRR